MKYLVLCIAWSVGLLSLGEFMTADSAAADRFDGETTADALNIRTGPGTTHDVVSVLPSGTRVSILELNDGWARVTADNDDGRVHGWVSGKYIDVYEVALPKVASAGLDDVEEELPALTQPQDEVVVEQEPIVIDDETTKPVVRDVVKAPVEPVIEFEPVVVPEQEIASLDGDAQLAPSVEPKLAAPRVAVVQPAEDVVEEKTEPVRVGSADPGIDVSPTTLVEEDKTVEPLLYEALDITCRQGYFSTGLDACTADIKVDVTVPGGFVDLVSDAVNVKCDVGFTYETNGRLVSETKNEDVQVVIADGSGTAVFQSRIDFLLRVDNVTRVEVSELDCGGASSE